MKSKFADALAGLKVVATGIKATNDTVPKITLLGIPNKFQLNRLATNAMGLKIGDRVRIISSTSDDINTKYYLAKTSESDETGAKISKANSSNSATSGVDMTFNYSGVWGILLQGDAKAAELGYEALAANDFIITGKTTGGKVRHRATMAVGLTLEDIGEHEVDGVMYHLFAMTDYVATRKSDEELADEVKPAAKATKAPEADVETEEEEEEEEEEETEE